MVQKLVEAHRQFLAFVEKRVESRAVAEDILQSAFVRALEHGSDIRGDESVIAWFYRVLRNAIVDHYRHRASGDRALAVWEREFAAQELPDAEMRRQICGCVTDLLETLKPEYRDALKVVEIDEASLAELAQRSGITTGNAAVRVHRAREALRKQVLKACGTCSEHGCLDCDCGAGNAGGCGPLQN